MTTRVTLIALLVLQAASTTISGTGTTTGSGFLLGGTAKHATDPENPANDVIKIDTSSHVSHPARAMRVRNGVTQAERKNHRTRQSARVQVVFRQGYGRRAASSGRDHLPGIVNAQRTTGARDRQAGAAAVARRASSSRSTSMGMEIPMETHSATFAHRSRNVRPSCWNYDDVTDELPRWDISQLALAWRALRSRATTP